MNPIKEKAIQSISRFLGEEDKREHTHAFQHCLELAVFDTIPGEDIGSDAVESLKIFKALGDIIRNTESKYDTVSQLCEMSLKAPVSKHLRSVFNRIVFYTESPLGKPEKYSLYLLNMFFEFFESIENADNSEAVAELAQVKE